MLALDASYSSDDTNAITLEVHNKSCRQLDLLWLDYDGEEQCYATLEPGEFYCQATYNTHSWRLRDSQDGCQVAQYLGEAALLVVSEELTVTVLEPSSAGKWQRPEWGQYRQRGQALGIGILAYDCVADDAVGRAAQLVQRMLQAAPAAVLRRLQQAQCQVAIIGKQQVTSDIPPHHFMKHCKGRDIDGSTRGLGGTAAIPVTSCGEENLTMVDDRHYPSENILVHEFGHTVMNVGLSEQQRQHICQLYQQAKHAGMYSTDIYMMENEDEYWAEGCQSWFDATVRCDVNDGINTREKLQQHDPTLAAALVAAYGDNPWRFPDDAPARLEPCEPEGRQQQMGAAAGAVLQLGQQQGVSMLQAPGGERMDRVRAASLQRRQGLMPAAASHCIWGCLSVFPRQLWPGLLRVQRGSTAAVKAR